VVLTSLGDITTREQARLDDEYSAKRKERTIGRLHRLLQLEAGGDPVYYTIPNEQTRLKDPIMHTRDALQYGA